MALEGPYQQMSPDSEDNPQVTQQQQQQSEQQKPRHKYKSVLYNFGITEVVFGTISVLLDIVTLIIAANYPTYTDAWYNEEEVRTEYYVYRYHHPLTYPSQGIWCGALLIVTGILGIKAKSNPSVCMFNANMAFAIITACFMVALMAMSGVAAATSGYGEFEIKSLIAIHSILAVLGLPAGIICIIHSAYCCAGVCCRRKAYQGPVTYVAQPHGTYQPQQMVRLANGQCMLVPFQPVAAHGYPQTTVPMVAGAVMYPPPQAGIVVPQVPIGHGQPTVIYPGGAQQPIQPGSTITPQTVAQSQPWDSTKNQAPSGNPIYSA